MKRGYIFLFIMGILLASCGQSQTSEPTVLVPSPTQDTSIVWEDDFEDGNLDGWEIPETGGNFFIENGVLKSGQPVEGGFFSAIGHQSAVTSGTWSFDFEIQRQVETVFAGISNPIIGLFGNLSLESWDTWMDVPEFRSLSVQVMNGRLYAIDYFDGKSITIAQYSVEDLLGMQHMDITRDEQGFTQYYLNGEKIFEFNDPSPAESQYFFIAAVEGMAFDNFMVRDKVKEISIPNQ
jgi:hypothetical protein